MNRFAVLSRDHPAKRPKSAELLLDTTQGLGNLVLKAAGCLEHKIELFREEWEEKR